MEVIFLIPVTVLIVETLLSSYWVSSYFRNGIAVFTKTFPFNEVTSISPDDLSSKFHRPSLSIVFVNISKYEIAFREPVKIILIHPFYVFLMRGIIKIDMQNKKIIVVGYANWYWLCLIFFFFLYILSDPLNVTHVTNMSGLLILILGILFLLIKSKIKLYIKIFKYLEEKYSTNSVDK